MSISKIVITGQVTRNPEKRFTDNNLAIASFAVNFGAEGEEKIIRVLAYGNVAEKVAQTVSKGQNVVIDGRLQTNSIKTESGTEKKFFEISAQGIEVIGQGQAAPSSASSDEVDFANEISNDDLIGEDEIPF